LWRRQRTATSRRAAAGRGALPLSDYASVLLFIWRFVWGVVWESTCVYYKIHYNKVLSSTTLAAGRGARGEEGRARRPGRGAPCHGRRHSPHPPLSRAAPLRGAAAALNAGRAPRPSRRAASPGWRRSVRAAGPARGPAAPQTLPGAPPEKGQAGFCPDFSSEIPMAPFSGARRVPGYADGACTGGGRRQDG
jgi:hypothetical protein